MRPRAGDVVSPPSWGLSSGCGTQQPHAKHPAASPHAFVQGPGAPGACPPADGLTSPLESQLAASTSLSLDAVVLRRTTASRVP